MTLTRDKLEHLTRDLLEKMAPPPHQALADAGLRPQDIEGMVTAAQARSSEDRADRERMAAEACPKIMY